METFAVVLFAISLSTAALATPLKIFCTGINSAGEQVRFVEGQDGRLVLERLDANAFVVVASYLMDDYSIGEQSVAMSGSQSGFSTGRHGSLWIDVKRTGAKGSRVFYAGEARVTPTVSTVRPMPADVFPISCQTNR